MSLHTLANHLQEAGRGDDKILVHMTPKEVGGLEALARAHGGTLTTNPHTGLPEAGFLDSILPMIAGAALTATGIGAPMAALLVGGAGALATGDVTKGLMMGLGAYGGAGIGESLAEAGASNAADQLAQGTVKPVTDVAATANYTTPINGQIPGVMSTNAANQTLGSGFYNTVPQEALTASGAPNQMLANSVSQGATSSIPSQAIPVTQAPTFGQNMSNMGEGAKNTFSDWGTAKDFLGNHKMDLAMAAAPGVYSAMNPDPVNFSGINSGSGSKGKIRPYKYDSTLNEASFAPTTSSAERNYYLNEPRFTPAAEGGIMGLAIGGMASGGEPPPEPGFMQPTSTNPVEQMSNMNAVGANTGYPMANLQTSVYTNPQMQRPETTNVVAPSADAGVDPYSGEVNFAFGGSTALASATAKDPQPTHDFAYDPKSQQFTETITTPPPSTGTTQEDIMRNAVRNFYAPVFGGFFPGFMSGSGSGMMGGIGNGALQNLFMQRGLAQLQPPQPTVTKKITGGIMNDDGKQMASGGSTGGYNLGGYSDGGRLLRGPGDGVSDSIPATIGDRQPARLADGEFVVPARIVSELGNGSTEAGARKLYAMMDRIQKNRKKSVGKNRVAVNSKSDKYLPA